MPCHRHCCPFRIAVTVTPLSPVSWTRRGKGEQSNLCGGPAPPHSPRRTDTAYRHVGKATAAQAWRRRCTMRTATHARPSVRSVLTRTATGRPSPSSFCLILSKPRPAALSSPVAMTRHRAVKNYLQLPLLSEAMSLPSGERHSRCKGIPCRATGLGIHAVPA